MIPAEAVEAAREASLGQLGLSGKPLPQGLLDARRESVLHLLEAAAPHMMANPSTNRQAGSSMSKEDKLAEAAERDDLVKLIHYFGNDDWGWSIQVAKAVLEAGYRRSK